MKPGWKSVALGKVAEIVSGATPRTSNPEYWGGEIAWATPKDLSALEGAFVSSTARTLTRVGLRSSGATVLPEGSVLFSSRAPIGHVAINTVPMATNQGFKSFVPRNGLIDAKYLYNWLRANRKYLEHLGTGATFKEVSKTVVSRVEVPLPPIEEQRRIAEVLGHADALQMQRRATLNRLDELRQAVFYEMFGAGDWPLIRLGNLVSGMRNGTSPSTRGSVPGRVLTLSAVTRGSFDPQEAKDALFSVTPSADKRVTQGDVLICRGNGNLQLVGRAVTVPHNLPELIIPDTVIAARIDITSMLPSYLSLALRQQQARTQIEAAARTTSGIHKINQQTLSAVELPTPPLNLQQRFVERIARVKSYRGALQAHEARLETVCDSLQSRAFSGQL